MSTPDPDVARYAEAARRVDAGGALDGCAATDGPFGAGNYDDLDGVPDAALRVSLGCGNPIAVAELREGDIVLDLGSGGGIDVLLSARRVGPTGFAYGIDATPEMLDLARRNAAEAGATNVEFLAGTIEDIPIDDASVDVVISNCVIVLSGDKDATFREIHPRAPPRWAGRDQRHRPRPARRRHPDRGELRCRRAHRRRLRGRHAARRPLPGRCRAHRPDRRRSLERHHPRHQTRMTMRPIGRRRWPGVRESVMPRPRTGRRSCRRPAPGPGPRAPCRGVDGERELEEGAAVLLGADQTAEIADVDIGPELDPQAAVDRRATRRARSGRWPTRRVGPASRPVPGCRRSGSPSAPWRAGDPT